MQLIDKLVENRDSGVYPFHMPGHKRICAEDDLLSGIYGIDVTETEGLDDLHNARGIIKEAEERAAECFGADETHFLVNGSTCGILAAVYGSVREGDHIVIGANCHRSVYNALMLSGATPIIITPEKESYYDIYGGIDPADVQKALENTGDINEEDGGRKRRTAVVITSPTYEGITSDIEKIAGICHEKGAVLIVDAAHGSHLGFSDKLPVSAVRSGADIVITGVHKTLPAMTQTALIHIKGNCPVRDRVVKMLPVFMTSSPSYVLMASIDQMVMMLSSRGSRMFEAYTERLEDFYRQAEAFEALSVLGRGKLTAAGSFDHDMGRIVVSDMTGTYSGRELADMLLKQYGICVEMAAASYVILITGIADTDEGFDRLKQALLSIDGQISAKRPLSRSRGIIRRIYDSLVGRRIVRRMARSFDGNMAAPEASGICLCDNRIKDALFEEDRRLIPVELAEGAIAGDLVCIYPPGTPVTIPGHAITGADVDRILEAKKKGLEITGLINGEIGIIWERSSI